MGGRRRNPPSTGSDSTAESGAERRPSPWIRSSMSASADLSSSTIRIIRRPWRPCAGYAKAVLTSGNVYTFVRSGGEVHFVLAAADPGSVSASGRAEQSSVWEVTLIGRKNLDLVLPPMAGRGTRCRRSAWHR